MEFILHRVNTIEQLASTPGELGVEIDLRDRLDRLILQHEPFCKGEPFDAYLRHYQHGTLVLNVKSERIEPRVLEEIRKAGTVRDYFFLDCSFPMLRQLIRDGEHRLAVRLSEFEPIEAAMALQGEVDWLWVDCFTRMPLTEGIYARVHGRFKICIVSPELQGHPPDRIKEFARQLRDFEIDAVCTKYPDRWRAVAAPR